jgi:hypothetical protein
MHKSLVFIACLFLFACTTKTKQEMLLGSWNFKGSPKNVNAQLVISKTTLTYKSNGFADSVHYVLSQDEKQLITTERNTNETRIDIIALTEQNLELHPTTSKDTIHLIREQ